MSDPEPKNPGYTNESLDMLKTAEGQSNAVFACFGSAAQHCQHFEMALADFLILYNKATNKAITVQELEDLETKLQNKTMGQLHNDFKKIVTINDPIIPEVMAAALKLRNYLMHHYFIECESGLATESGRFEMINELVEIERTMRVAKDITNGMRVAMAEALGLPDKSDAWTGRSVTEEKREPTGEEEAPPTVIT